MIGELLILILLWLFDSTIRHYISLLCKLLSDDLKEPLPPLLAKKNLRQNDLSSLPPEFFEFETVEDVKNGEKDDTFERKAIQKAICIVKDGGDVEVDVKKWQFICKVCNKAFESVDLCEAHIRKNEHTFLSSETTKDEDFDMLRVQLETLRKMNGESIGEEKEKTINGVELHKPRSSYDRKISQDFIPIYFGNWSKVICELRHRFGQTCHGDCKNLNALDIADLSLLKHQTFPKTIQEVLEHTDRTEALQNEYLVRNSCPQNPVTSTDNPKAIQEPKHGICLHEDHIQIIKESKDSRTSTETELSEITLPSDADQPKEQVGAENASRTSSTSSETANCHIEKAKVCVDFVTRLLYCESCYTTFRSVEQAFTHFKTDGDSDKSADQYTWDEYDVMHQSNQILGDKGPGDIQMAGTNHDTQDADDKILENFSEQDGTQEDQPPSEKPPEFTDTLKSSFKIDSENQNDVNSQDFYSEKMPLFETEVDGKQKRKKKKKKKKAWRMVKRTVIYAIIFLF